MSDKKIEVSEKLLHDLMANQEKNTRMIASLTQQLNGGADNKQKKTNNPGFRTARVAFINERPVIQFKNVGTERKPGYIWKKPNPADPDNPTYMIGLIVQGITDPIVVPYSEFLEEAEFIPCKILDEKREDKSYKDGVVIEKVVNEKWDIEMAEEVDLVVNMEHITLVVELPNGDKLDIDSRYVNIN